MPTLSLLDLLSDPAVVVDDSGVVTRVNDAALRRLRATVGAPVAAILGSDDDHVRVAIAEAKRAEGPVDVNIAPARGPRDTVPMLGSVTALAVDEGVVLRVALGLAGLRSPDDEDARLRAANRELFAQQKLRHRLVWQQKRLSAFLDAMPLGAIECDRDGRIVDANSTALHQFGTDRAGIDGTRLAWWMVIDRPMQQAVSGAHQQIDETGADTLFGGQSPVYCTARRSDGTRFPARLDWSPLTVDSDDRRGTACLITDITELRAAQRQLQQLADTDALTGALNRRRFLDVARDELDRMARYGREAALVLFDLDHFKAVNDTWGHAAGDDALRGFAAVVDAQRRISDAFGRWGGEEFVALLPETSLDAAEAFANRVRTQLERTPLAARAAEVRLTVSAGVTDLRVSDGIDAAIRRADQALYRAKDAGRNRVEVQPATTPPEAESAE